MMLSNCVNHPTSYTTYVAIHNPTGNTSIHMTCYVSSLRGIPYCIAPFPLPFPLQLQFPQQLRSLSVVISPSLQERPALLTTPSHLCTIPPTSDIQSKKRFCNSWEF